MHIRSRFLAVCIAVAAIGAPALVHGFDLRFLDQAPLRFFNDADLELMGKAAQRALHQAADGEGIDWNNEATGNSGRLTPLHSFERDGLACRRLEVTSTARQATGGSATSRLDFCKVDDTWRILTVAP